MATTVAELAAEGRGRVVFILEITGVGVFSTDTVDPSGEDWYDDGGWSSVSPWLVFDVDDLQDEVDFGSSELKVPNLGLVIADRSGQMTALVKDLRGWTRTYLTTTLQAGATSSAVVEDTSDFPSSGDIYIGQEAIGYSSKTATTLAGLTRGKYNTRDVEHYADTSDPPGGIPISPAVATGPHSLVNRRALLRMAVIDESDGSVGASSVIYRGRVSKGTRVSRGRYAITLEHISAILKDKVGTGLIEGTMPHKFVWYDGVYDDTSLGYIHIFVTEDDGTLAAEGKVALDAGRYRNGAELCTEINRVLALWKVAQSLTSVYIWQVRPPVGGGKARLVCGQNIGHTVSVVVRKGDPLWALGFAAGSSYWQPAGATENAEFEAADATRQCVIDFRLAIHGGFGASGQPTIPAWGGDADFSIIDENRYIAAPGQPAVKWTDNTGGILTLDGNTVDRVGASDRPAAWMIDAEEDRKVQQVVYVDGTLDEALGEMLGLGGDDQVNKIRHVADGLTSDDVDTDELTDALEGVEPGLNYFHHVILEPTELWSLVGPQFAALGICPRITTEGRIGWTRLRQPITSEASTVELDEDIWAAREASQTEARLDEAPLVSEVMVRYGNDYRAGDDHPEWRTPIRFLWREGARIFGRLRSATYDCPGLWPRFSDLAVFEETLRRRLVFGQFSAMGREAAVVEIPCVWTSRQLYCGDIVKITHELAPDTVEGDIGLSGRLGIVVGRRLKLTDSGSDTLLVRLGPDVNSGGIAPCALITSDDSDDTGTVGDTAKFSDDDLAYFEAGDSVQIIEWDATSATVAPTKIASIVGGAVTFQTSVFDPSGTNMPSPCLMIPDSWDDSEHQDYAYIADTSLGLGSTPDDGQEWVL